MDTCSRRVSALGILCSSIRASRRDPGILTTPCIREPDRGRQAGPAAKASRSPRGAVTLTTHYEDGPFFQLPFYGEREGERAMGTGEQVPSNRIKGCGQRRRREGERKRGRERGR